MTAQERSLPQSDSVVQVRLLDGGSFMAETDKVHAGVKNERFRMYNWAFHIFHPEHHRHVLWDLGMVEDREAYTPWVHKFMLDDVRPVGPRVSIEEQLERHGVGRHKVDTVIFSHAHWDHSRPIRSTFPNATALFGPGTSDHCSPGHLHDPANQWDGRFFDPQRSTERWYELDGPWKPFGPFDKAMDFFGDGSFFVIQAPGHMPGNLCAAARIPGGSWVLLGSDCCHSRELLDGEFDFAVFTLGNGQKACLQTDIPAAKETVRRIKELEEKHNVHVALAHDARWMKEGSDKVLMGLLDDVMADAAKERITDDKRP